MTSRLEKGISVVIPSFAGNDTIWTTLASLENQTLDTSLFEVIVVLNGEGTEKVSLQGIRDRYPKLCLRLFKNHKKGAGSARNIGISLAGREFITFVDDDDTVEPNFLATGLRYSHADRCVLLPIHDEVGNRRIKNNSLNVRIASFAGQCVPLAELSWALGFNACKFVPTAALKKYRYKEHLQSGEDLVFFANLLCRSDFKIEIPSKSNGAAYVRRQRSGSISRKVESFDFNVRQRLMCIKELQRIPVPKENLVARKSLENAQFQFIERYLLHHPEDLSRAIDTSISFGIGGYNWSSLRKESAKRLVVSYCFPPYADTSANVVSKVIRTQGIPVDVYHANMRSVRKTDESTLKIVAPYVVNNIEIQVPPSFANWDLISEFGVQVADHASERMGSRDPYFSMYTRALWSGSHVAGAILKSRYPNLEWEAEFSDPLSFGVDGKPRLGKLTLGRVTELFEEIIRESAWSKLPYDSHFELTELVAMILSDQLIFTNANQRTIMLSRRPAAFREFVEEKSLVRHHVIPTPEMYQLMESDYEVESGRINMGYFGNFYGNRGIEEIVHSMERLKEAELRELSLHIFTSRPDELHDQLAKSKAASSIRINHYVPYLEFLNLSKRFDCLIVNDTETSGTSFDVNPFLPSKYSDYRGSGVPIWGLVTEGSPLSQMPLSYICTSSDSQAIDEVLSELISSRR